MAGCVNQVQLLGHLGKDPESNRTNGGNLVVKFSVATTKSWRDRNSGERKEKTEWHNIVVWSEGLAKVAEDYLGKGSKVFVQGELQTRQWEKDGQKHYTTEIVLQGYDAKLVLLDSRDGGNGGGRRDDHGDDRNDRRGGRDDGYDNRSRGNDRQQSRGDNSRSFNRDMDDEIPF